MSLYLAAYDISVDRRRRAVAAVLRRKGTRLQESVFEVRLEPDDVVELRREIGPLLDRHDLFDLYPVDERGTRGRFSWMRTPEVREAVVLL